MLFLFSVCRNHYSKARKETSGCEFSFFGGKTMVVADIIVLTILHTWCELFWLLFPLHEKSNLILLLHLLTESLELNTDNIAYLAGDQEGCW